MQSILDSVGIWGDQGNGMYRNPVLFGDYSDPDVCRVGEDYYLVCSEFNYMGMPVLHSKDLVNWNVIGKVFDRFPGREYDDMKRYGRGSWAPSIRYHNGIFYVYFCTPDEGVFMARTEDPAGNWELIHVKEVAGWEDPCPHWDKDGQAWLSHSVLGAGPIYLHRMSEDGTGLLDEGRVIFEGDGAEGPKWYDTEDGVLMMFPQGGTSMGWQMALRGTSMEGPFEARCVCKQGNTWINGPHQGALVDTPSGEWWFLHFSHCGVAGRVVYLQPVTMIDGWPVVGKLMKDKPYCGEPVWLYRKPNLPQQAIVCTPTSDSFTAKALGLQWQWNHNPVDENWSLAKRNGWYSVKGDASVTDIFEVKNILTQRLIGASGNIRVRVSVKDMEVGQQAGLVMFGRDPYLYAIVKTPEGMQLTVSYHGDIADKRQACNKEFGNWQEKRYDIPAIAKEEIWLQFSIQNLAELRIAYSVDGSDYIHIRQDGFMSEGVWKGARIGLMTWKGNGWAAFSNFQYIHDGPCGRDGLDS